MKKLKLALGTPVIEPFLSQLREKCEITPVSQLITPGIWPPEEEIRAACTGHDIVVIEADKLGADTLKVWKDSGLKLLGCARGNPVNVDATACRALDIPLFYTPGRNAQSVAEYTLTLMLMLQKRVQTAMKGMADGRYVDRPVEDVFDVPDVEDIVWMNERMNVYTMQPLGEELYGHNLTVIGFGAIGRRVATMAMAFGMHVSVYDPYCEKSVVESVGAVYGTLDQVLSDADIVSIHLPVTTSTKGIVNETWFSLMKSGAKLINTARAAVVDQRAMVNALQTGRLSGAAIDVMWIEPCPANHPFLAMDNVIVLPHQAGATVDIERWQSRMIAEEMQCFVDGKPIVHLYNR